MLEIDPLLEIVVISHWLRQMIFSAPFPTGFFSPFFIFLNLSLSVRGADSHALNDSWLDTAFPQIGCWPQSHQSRILF